MKNDNVGKIVGIYTIVGVNDTKDTDGHLLYRCKCNICGGTFLRRLSDAKIAESCQHTYVNWINKRICQTYKAMIDRCYDPNNKSYRWYGAKGVRVCQEWINHPNSFENWALNNGYTNELTIDRIDANKDYCPENCQWIPLKENVRKAGKVNWITVNDITLTGRQWAEKFKIGINTINRILNQYGVAKTQELIEKMLVDPPCTKERSRNQSLLSVYGIQV